MTIEIPNYDTLEIENIVFDYNGTLATGGSIDIETGALLEKIAKHYRVFVITADTFGTVESELDGIDLEVMVLSSDNHTKEKAALIEKLGATKTIALGNGNNDQKMLKTAVISIAIVGEEGCAVGTMLVADIVCKCIVDAMEMLADTKRISATMRR
ncbi:MAG: haloacid dehalogenase [Sulfurovum sp.]|nr:haloacid dehalogenase [Sulfurovum sp.]